MSKLILSFSLIVLMSMPEPGWTASDLLEECRFKAFDQMIEAAPPQLVESFGLEPEMGNARCGSLEVFENRDTMEGRTIALNIVVLPATGPAEEYQPDPIFYFVGGPGAAAAGSAFYPAVVLGKARRSRDIVLVDQRGTGGSNPLVCPQFNRADPNVALKELLQDDAVKACHEQLSSENDLRFYTTPYAIQDIEDVRKALGYEKINLLGGSYGTRPPLAYMRRYPDAVRTAYLSGVTKTESYYPYEYTESAPAALEGIFEACLERTECASVYPDPAGDLERALAYFDKGPVFAEVTPPGAQTTQKVQLNSDVLIEHLRLMMYTAGGAINIPALVKQAADTGNFDAWAQATLLGAANFVEGVAFFSGMWLSVSCTESTRFVDEEMIESKADRSAFGNYRIRRHKNACQYWTKGNLPDDYREPVSSDVPTLIIAGIFDPAIPLDMAKDVAQHLPNGLVVETREGHAPTDFSCTGSVVDAFISKGSVEGLDISCLKAVDLPPFVTP